MRLVNCERSIHVGTLEEASAAIRRTIEDRDMGGEKWYGYPENGYVYENCIKIAHISYNGRIWKG